MKKKSFIIGLVMLLCISLIPVIPPVKHAEAAESKNFMIYYRAWRDKEMKGVNTSLPDENWLSMSDIPYGINIVNVFSYVPPGQEELAEPFFKKLKEEYEPELHARGVKLIRGFDYTKLLEIPYAGAFPTEKEFDDYAKALLDELMLPWGLDGLDIDMETSPTDAEVRISDGVINALSKYIGPKANNGTLFLYDTNGQNTKPFQNVSDSFDLLAYQQYGSNAERTAFASDAYSPFISKNKFLPGLTFPEEQDPVNRWYDATLPYEQSNIYQVAKYSRENNLAGMFLYAFDRDGKTYDEPDINSISPSNLLWTKTAILEVNGYSLDSAKSFALHHLNRIKYAKSLSSEEIQAIEKNIQNAKNLYDVNVAILGATYAEAVNPTYDPILEKELMAIDLTAATAALDKAEVLLQNNDLPALKAARDKLATLLGDKKYTVSEVNSLTASLQNELQNVAKPVAAKYQDESGNKIADDVVLTGELGASFAFSKKEIPGYTFVKTEGAANGTFSAQAQEVIYVYSKADSAVLVNVDQAKPENTSSTTKTTKLPQTGDSSVSIWVAFAAIIAGLLLLKKKKVTK
ncbi:MULTISPECIES: MucBP domain-containing protein [unclassified Listeria]|uniref:EndoS/ChiA family endoglycosidase n=1 Tax=unclassified Listeria TaxID=2642072 RepID=UPI000B591B17|nr:MULTISPECIES: MucBP domain-containing protein [unclassified Listeria]